MNGPARVEQPGPRRAPLDTTDLDGSLTEFAAMLVSRGIRLLGAAGLISLLGIMDPRWGVPLAVLVLLGAMFSTEALATRSDEAQATHARYPGWSAAHTVKDAPILPAWAKVYLTSLSWSQESEDLQVSGLFQPAAFIRGQRSFTIRDLDQGATVRERIQVGLLIALLVLTPAASLIFGWALAGWRADSVWWWAWLTALTAGYWCAFALSAALTDAASRRCSDEDLVALCGGTQLRIVYLPQPKRSWIRGGALGLPGFRRILVSAIDYENLPREELRALVAHEAAHLTRRHDLLFGNGPLVLMSLLPTLAVAVYWITTVLGLSRPQAPGWLADPPRILALPILGLPLLFLAVRGYIGQRWLEPDAYRDAARAVGAGAVIGLLAKTPRPLKFWGVLPLPDVAAELREQKEP